MNNRLAWLGLWLLCIVAALFGLTWMLVASMADPKGKRAWQLAEGFDRMANAAIGGSSRMTISAHAGRDIDHPWARWFCKLLHIVDPEHCSKSYEAYQHSHIFGPEESQ